MRIVFLELPEWEEEYLLARIDPAHAIVSTMDADVVSPFITRS